MRTRRGLGATLLLYIFIISPANYSLRAEPAVPACFQYAYTLLSRRGWQYIDTATGELAGYFQTHSPRTRSPPRIFPRERVKIRVSDTVTAIHHCQNATPSARKSNHENPAAASPGLQRPGKRGGRLSAIERRASLKSSVWFCLSAS